jgi:EAL domain-containing protein (putative c-di-GMP-specific phosphodiesterase class I)
MADRLLREADIALYEAKTTGRNQARIYSADMGERVARRTLISKELSQLLKHDGKDGFGPGQVGCLSVMYQPQVNLVSGEMVGAEALLRWQHPDQDRMRAAEFIQVAEDTGLIIALGQWVLEQACREAANWPENLRVAVNVSGQQLAKGQLVPMVGQALRMTGLPAHRLELEITETALMSKPEEGRSILLDLRQLGVKIALDDFGTGYSSLAYLSTLPVDVVKLDRAFVVAMRYDTKVQTVVASIIQLCQSLGVTTLAEGIEDKHQLDLLLRHGCQLGQGFLYDPALPAAAISTWSIKKALDHVLTV